MHKIAKRLVLPLATLAGMVACGDDDVGTPAGPNPDGEVAVYVTALDGTSRIKRLPNLLAFGEPTASNNTLAIDPQAKRQTMDGFGAALTGSSASLLHNNDGAMEALFGQEGIALSYVRLVMGASDFTAIGNYSYNDIVGGEDLLLDNFSIAPDKQENNPIIPVAKAIVARNGQVSFMATPWSAPAWMKDSKSMVKGRLLEQYYGVYANYFAKFLDVYRQEGIPISAVTPQNEPLYEPPTYPGMLMPAESQAAFVGKHLGPRLAADFPEVKIIGYDHNYFVDSDPDYPLTLLRDPDAAKYLDGIAYHAYGGQPQDIDKVREAFPNTAIYFTEQSGIQGEQTTFGGEIAWFMANVFAGTIRRGAKTILLWNLALDPNNGPQNGGCATCRGVVTITGTGAVIKNPEYYLLGHFTKFVKPGASWIATQNFAGRFENLVFQNPDGSYAAVLLNTQGADQNITVTVGGQSFAYALPGRALTTLVWGLP